MDFELGMRVVRTAMRHLDFEVLDGLVGVVEK